MILYSIVVLYVSLIFLLLELQCINTMSATTYKFGKAIWQWTNVKGFFFCILKELNILSQSFFFYFAKNHKIERMNYRTKIIVKKIIK